MSILARCDNCGFTWEASNLIGLGAGAGVVVKNVVTNCPQCNGSARILDGEWTGTNDGAVLVSGPPESQAIYSAFKKLVQDARKGRLTPAQVQREAAQLNEGFGLAVGLLIQRYPKTAIFIIALAAMLKFMNFDTKLDVNELVRQVVEYVEAEKPSAGQTSGGHLKEAENEKPSNDIKPTEHPPTQKHDRIRHKIPPSQTRRVKNKARRSALRKQRTDFNPKK